MIRVVTFDADGTLWDFERVMRESLALALDELRARAPRHAAGLTVDAMIRTRDRVATEVTMRGATHEAIRRAAFERTLDEIGLPDRGMVSWLNDLYMHHRFAAIRPYDDVVPTLDALARRRLGLISDGNSYPERCGLPGRFAFAVFAHDYGTKKPDPHLFGVAIRLAECRAEEILHVGDSLERDVAGAKSVGMRTAWINRARRPNDTNIQPDVEVHSLTELPLHGGWCA